MTAFVTAEALPGINRYFDRAPDVVPQAARMALNRVIAGPGRKRIKDGMQKQVAFPPRYIDDRRLSVGRRATNSELQASLVARQRGTSLARFDPGRSVGKKGATVMVRPGHARTMPNAFFIRLRAGDELTDDSFNLGLAIRLKPGERVLNKKSQPFNGDSSLALLYGPSVDQIMQDVALEESGAILDDVDLEFTRQFARMMESA